MKKDYFNDTVKDFTTSQWQSILHYTIGTFGKKEKYSLDEKFIKALSYFMDNNHPENQSYSEQDQYFSIAQFILKQMVQVKQDKTSAFVRYVVDVSDIQAKYKRMLIQKYIEIRKYIDRYVLDDILNPSSEDEEKQGDPENEQEWPEEEECYPDTIRDEQVWSEEEEAE